ncbi:hypothetical protein MCHI_003382 [Candidatus Magnetoovum chiemensis]|nr:hypothetical protein MCHI_003382 [Candidatus Magnetoovum chiemensis]
MGKEQSMKDEKVVFFTSKEQLEEIDDFRFNSRLSSRAEAVRRLIDIGLEYEKKKIQQELTKSLLIAAQDQKEYGKKPRKND